MVYLLRALYKKCDWQKICTLIFPDFGQFTCMMAPFLVVSGIPGIIINEPRSEKTGLLGFRPGLT